MKKKSIVYFILPILFVFYGCGVPDIDKIKDRIKVDKSAPELTIKTIDRTSETFSITILSTEEGRILYENACKGDLQVARKGRNTIHFNDLPDGEYDFCKISIIDHNANLSKIYTIPKFTIQKSRLPQLETIIPIPTITANPTPYFTFRTSQAGTIEYHGSCSSALKDAHIGNNIVQFDRLADGTYNDCSITLTNQDQIKSESLHIDTFTIDRDYLPTMPQVVKPLRLATLNSKVEESSGIITIHGHIFTHNDSGNEAKLYEIDVFGNIRRTILVQNANNRDWEDITQDADYVYIGDIGNNLGNRKDLVIYRIDKHALLTQKTVKAEPIRFSYADQTKFDYDRFATPFDAEALMSYHDKLYIFTKNWKNKKTSLYAVPKIPGKYTIKAITSKKLDFYVTGADFDHSTNRVVLIGYGTQTAGKPHILFLENFHGENFFSGKQTNIKIDDIPVGFRQIEAVAFDTENRLLITSETLDLPLLGKHPATLFTIKL